MYSILDMIELVIAGGFFGAVGQAIREIFRLAETRPETNVTFSISRLVTNLSVGFVAGTLLISILAKSAAYRMSSHDVFTLLVFGYAAGDFVERIIRAVGYRDTGGKHAEASMDSPGKSERKDRA